MRMIRAKPSTFAGSGHLRFSGHQGVVTYAIDGDPSKLRAGIARLRGFVTTTVELAELAFRAGEGMLSLEDGRQFRVVMLGHSTGGADVFLELRG